MPSVPLSIVVPCYNEEGCLGELHRRLGAAAKAAVGDGYEIVLINDGSRDRTWPIMQELAAQDPHLVAINLSRNHGHQLALTAGLDLCAGERILIIDADLQDPPELLGEMLAKMDAEAADVVYAVRRARAGETAFKRGTAKAFYRILFKLSEIEIPLDTGDFRLMSRRALDALLALPEQARFIRGMVAWVGFKQVPILYDRAERLAGETNYPLRKMLRLAVDAITGFSTAPLRFASHVGLWLAAAAMLLLGYIAIGFFTGTAIQGWTSLMLVVVILGAVQMFVLGMIGEYLGRLYIEAKRRPLYIVAEIAGQAGGRPGLGHVAAAQDAPVRAMPAPVQEPTRSPPAKRRASSANGRSRAAPERKSSRTES
ncbi:MAG TPA: glycosyltransferase family 2 protein [Allosphingosinicella sp.]|nr:glycosyltransferase family 2 protein [Allosphingosinicella sp.]